LTVSGNIAFDNTGGVGSLINLNSTIGLSNLTLTGDELTIGSGATENTGGSNFTFNGIFTDNGTINAGSGNITLTDSLNNNASGGIIINGSLIGYDITLHSEQTNSGLGGYGAQIRLNSGSQITGTHSVTLQDDNGCLYSNCGSTYAGVELNSGATVTTPTLTVQTGGSVIRRYRD